MPKPKRPKLIIRTGDQARTLRKKLGLNQAEFWGRVGTTQSGGSRYESGRDIPDAVLMLLHIAYGPERQAALLHGWLRTRPEQASRG